MNFKSNFIFIVCQAGAESALKTEISKTNPELKFSYSRPGFVTFKSEKELTVDFELKSIFTFAYGLNISRFKKNQLSELFKLINTESVHVIEREFHASDTEPKEYSFGLMRDQFLSDHKKELSKFKVNQIPNENEMITDIIIIDDNEFWLGVHKHNYTHRAFVGGRPEIRLPQNAPSRAYLKLEEACLVHEIKFNPNETAVEIGSAPGGASLALLNHGLKVVGIDSAQMSDVVLKNKNFTHLRKSIVDVQPKELPPKAEWILIDINQKSEVALKAIELMVKKYKNTIKGMILTFKISDLKSFSKVVSTIQKELKRLQFKKIRIKHLTNNKNELNVTVLK